MCSHTLLVWIFDLPQQFPDFSLVCGSSMCSPASSAAAQRYQHCPLHKPYNTCYCHGDVKCCPLLQRSPGARRPVLPAVPLWEERVPRTVFTTVMARAFFTNVIIAFTHMPFTGRGCCLKLPKCPVPCLSNIVNGEGP